MYNKYNRLWYVKVRSLLRYHVFCHTDINLINDVNLRFIVYGDYVYFSRVALSPDKSCYSSKRAVAQNTICVSDHMLFNPHSKSKTLSDSIYGKTTTWRLLSFVKDVLVSKRHVMVWMWSQFWTFRWNKWHIEHL